MKASPTSGQPYLHLIGAQACTMPWHRRCSVSVPEVQMKNSERRMILQAQHAGLRIVVEAARNAAHNVLAQGGSRGELQGTVLALQQELVAHLAEEERLLVPILPGIDAWGTVRLDLLRAEHAHQRAVLAVLTGHHAWPAGSVVAARTLALCEDLLTDMEFEERELINEQVLRDDLVLLDASDA
jgi:hemerythrin HHE cation binding domain-containing protein